MPKTLSAEMVVRERRHLYEERDVLINYIRVRLRREDWHGVRDACSDLEAIDARLNEIHRMEMFSVENVRPEVPSVRTGPGETGPGFVLVGSDF